MSDIGDKLEKLAALRSRGVLTEAEFAEQKARLLGTDTAVPPPQPASPLSDASPAPAENVASSTPTARPTTAPGKLNPRMLGIGAVALVGAVAAIHAMSGGSRSASSSTTSSYAGPAAASSSTEAAQADAAPSATAPASTGGTPTEDDVKRVLVAVRAGRPQDYRFNSVQISAPQPITPAQQMSYEAPAGGNWFLVRADYVWDASSSDWNDPQAYIHDVVGSYAMFRNQMGEWTMSADAQPGDKDVLRGGYTN